VKSQALIVIADQNFMPFLSKKQNAWAHTPTGTKALGGKAKVKEWEQVTDYSKIPYKVAHTERKKKSE
jgi:hypothetical protein